MTELQDYATEISIWKEEYLVKIPRKNLKTLQNDLSKLEALKKWIYTPPNSYLLHGPFSRTSFESWRAEGLKILEAETTHPDEGLDTKNADSIFTKICDKYAKFRDEKLDLPSYFVLGKEERQAIKAMMHRQNIPSSSKIKTCLGVPIIPKEKCVIV